jgi:hypothetical protein
VGTDVGYDFCSVKVNAVFSCCGVFGYYSSLVLQSGVSDVFQNDVMACFAVVHLTTGAGDFVFVFSSLSI